MKQAVILAAGEGQRLRPFTLTKPKIMISIAGRPVLQYVIESLAQIGIRDIVLVVGYRKEQVFDYIGSGEKFGVSINYITQEKQLGTAHALAQAKEATDKEFLVLPGDNLIEASTIARFAAIEPDAVLVKQVDSPTRYGVVTFEADGMKEIIEKPREAGSNLVNTGIYAFTREIFEYLNADSGIPDALNSMIADGHPIKTCETDGTWLDAVYPWDILGLNSAVLQRIPARLGGTIETGVILKGMVAVGEGTVIHSNCYIVGPVTIGENSDIGPNTCIRAATSIGDNVTISSFVDIRNSVIENDVNIGPNSTVHDSVIDKGCVIKGHFTAYSGQTEVKINEEHHQTSIGAMLGEGCTLGNNVIAQPGVIIGNYSQVQPLKVLSGRLPDRSLVL